MSIRSDKGKIIFVHFDQDTVHNRTQIVVGRCKYRLHNSFQNQTAFRGQVVAAIVECCLYRIIFGTFSRHRKLSLLGNNFHLIGLRIDFECQRLFGKFLQNIQQYFGRYRYFTFFFQTFQFYPGFHGRLFIRCCCI